MVGIVKKYGEAALKDPENIGEKYKEKVKERLTYFTKNIRYALNFYIMKIASMWTENTYAAVRSNGQDKYSFENIIEALTFYQKVLLILMCAIILKLIIRNKKNLSLEVILLITIFIGGFLFHILWEAKSRYILPYIVVLIPLAAIYQINKKN